MNYRILKVACLSAISFLALDAVAFKPKTHVFIAQEIIDELKESNGKLSFVIDGVERTVTLNREKFDAIMRHESEFRAGAIGPDASPDIAIGQMFIHSGTSRDDNGNYPPTAAETTNANAAWNTNDWLNHLESNALYENEKAYTYGVRLHAASDMISHTYVNTYAGNSFKLQEHANEPTAELRHILVENFIEQFTPGLSDLSLDYKDSVRLPTVQRASDSYQAVLAALNERLDFCQRIYRDLLEEETYAVAQAYLRNCIDKNVERYNINAIPAVDKSKQDLIQRTFLYDKHLMKSWVSQGLGNGITSNVNDRYTPVMKQYLANPAATHFTTIYNFRYQLEEALQSDWLADLDTDVMKHLVYWWTEQHPQILLDGLSSRLRDITLDQVMELKEVADSINTVLGKTTLKVNDFIISDVQRIERAMTRVGELNLSILDAKSRIDNVRDELSYLSCRLITPKWICNKISRLKNEIRDLENKVLSESNKLLMERDELSNALSKIQSVIKGLYYVHEDLNGESNPIKSLIKNWMNGIDAAMTRYADVGLGMMTSTMDPDMKMQDALNKWAFEDCDLRRVFGLEHGEGPGCLLDDKLKKIQDSLDFLFTVATGSDPLLASIKKDFEDRIKEKIQQKMEDAETVVRARLDAEENELRAKYPEFIAMYEILDDIITPSKLAVTLELVFNTNYYKKLIGTSSKYMGIEQVASKILREMRVLSGTQCNGRPYCFNRSSYPVVYNSIVMSKIALLDRSELQQLYSVMGLGSVPSGSSSLNVFSDSLLSIDGNHQWLGKTIPPYLRANGMPSSNDMLIDGLWFIPLEYENELTSTRPFAKQTPLMFGSLANTKAIFNRLFIGPLNEAIYDPENLPVLNISSIQSYMNEVTAAVNNVNTRLANDRTNFESIYGIRVPPFHMTFNSLFDVNPNKEVSLPAAYTNLYRECKGQVVWTYSPSQLANCTESNDGGSSGGDTGGNDSGGSDDEDSGETRPPGGGIPGGGQIPKTSHN